MSEKIWFVTGASRGIGKCISRRALEHGDKVVATARDISTLDDLVQKFPGRICPVRMDANDPDTISAAVEKAIETFGNLHVLVNNAGYGLQGMIEEVSMEQVRQQMETNFFGLVYCTQQILPVMRKQNDGFIANISSVAGLRGMAGFGIYNASKFAVEGFTEALAQEVRSFNIRVCAVEPGPYRTDWAGDSLHRSDAMKNLEENSPYAEINRKFKKMLDDRSGKQPGDPEQIAAVLVQYSEKPVVPLHLLFGDVGIQAWEERKALLGDESFMKLFTHDKWNI